MFNFLAVSVDVCGSQLSWIISLFRVVIRIISIAAPFALIIFGSLDFFKAIIAGDEKEMKAKRKPFVGRLVAAIIILLMPTIINLIMKVVAQRSQSDFVQCWNSASSTRIDIPTEDSELNR